MVKQSKVKGVLWQKSRKSWAVRVYENGRPKSIYHGKDKAEAEEAERKEREDALPDKRKLIVFADSLLEIIVPDVVSELAQEIAGEARGALVELSKETRMRAQNL